MRLVREVIFSKSIMPVCLPRPSTNYNPIVATLAGWGTFQQGSDPTTNIPYEVDVDTMNNAACTDLYLLTYGLITGSMICAARPGNGFCQGYKGHFLLHEICCFYLGDSGGPLMAKEGNFFSVIGIVSFLRGCALAGNPGVYARVNSRLGWVSRHIRGKTCQKP